MTIQFTAYFKTSDNFELLYKVFVRADKYPTLENYDYTTLIKMKAGISMSVKIKPKDLHNEKRVYMAIQSIIAGMYKIHRFYINICMGEE